MLKIWGRKNSINVQKVLWACGELALPIERIDAGMAFGVNNTPEYKAMNPNGLVPLMNDDGFLLWESHAARTRRAFHQRVLSAIRSAIVGGHAGAGRDAARYHSAPEYRSE